MIFEFSHKGRSGTEWRNQSTYQTRNIWLALAYFLDKWHLGEFQIEVIYHGDQIWVKDLILEDCYRIIPKEKVEENNGTTQELQ